MTFRKIKPSSNPKKATAWKNFSRYIRMRDALATTGTLTHARCITCREIHPIIGEMEAGHAIPGRTNGILFDESLVFAQCRACNRSGGEPQAFKRILIERHGEAWWTLKVQAKHAPTDLSDVELDAINKECLRKIKWLKRALDTLTDAYIDGERIMARRHERAR